MLWPSISAATGIQEMALGLGNRLLATSRRVAAQLELGQPVVAGHSLGGMLAVMWAKSHPAISVVNLDGHGRRTLAQYAGIAEEDARRRVTEAEACIGPIVAVLK